MEKRKKHTTGGVLFWTPAPVGTSPTSPIASEEDWEDEYEEMKKEKEKEFHSQMDENGIIGLKEALEDVELRRNYGDGDEDCDPPWYVGGPSEPRTAEDLFMPPIELSCSLNDDTTGKLEVLIEDKDLREREEEEVQTQLVQWESTETPPEIDEQLSNTGEVTIGEEEDGTRMHSKRKRNEQNHTTGPAAMQIMAESYPVRGDDAKIGFFGESSYELPTFKVNVSSKRNDQNGMSDLVVCKPRNLSPCSPPNLPHPIPQSPSSTRASCLNSCLYFSSKELADHPGTEAEIFPEADFTESLPESCSSHVSQASKNHRPHYKKEDLKARVSPSPTTISTEKISPNQDRKGRHKEESGKSTVDKSKRGTRSYRTPDFSKVEPRVRFPKSGYKPPKSRGSSKKYHSAEPPLVFKSPADIVREVLLSNTDGPSPPSDPAGPQTSVPNSTVPDEFRSPQQATTLVEQLQEDYNRLLTKYAEAENTIDRLRLEAKVNLCSEPPKSSHSVQSGMIQDGTKFMTLNFPQSQRTEISSSSCHLNGLGAHQVYPACPSTETSSSSRGSLSTHVGYWLTSTLSNQADKFLQQVHTFEDLLKSGKLKPFEQIKGLSQLVQGLDSLEKGYLAARNEHRLLQQRGVQIGSFDPNRELEGLVFQCGLCVEELKEQIEKTRQDQPTSTSLLSPPTHPTPLSIPTEEREPITHPESPVLPLPGEFASDSAWMWREEVSSASGESEGQEAGMEEEGTQTFKPLDHKHTLMDRYQSFKALPKTLDQDLRKEVTDSPSVGGGIESREERMEGHFQATENMELQIDLRQRHTKTDEQESPLLPTAKPRASKSDPPSPRISNQSPTFPSHPTISRRRREDGKSHSSSLTSLGDSAVLERPGSQVPPERKRVLSQDGIISPETDSGFVGSESSRLTPAAVPSHLHQRASCSVSAPQAKSLEKPPAGPVSAGTHPASSNSDRPKYMEHSTASRVSTPGKIKGQPSRTTRRERRSTSGCSSPQHWTSQTPLARAGSGTSDFGLDSGNTNMGSEEEEEQDEQFAESTSSQQHSYSRSPSPAAPYRHGDPLDALGSGQETTCNEAFQILKAEVSRLKERLESSLRNTKPLGPVTVPPSAQGNYTQPNTSTPRVRSGQRGRKGGREERAGRRRNDDLEEERTSRPDPRKRSFSVPRRRPELDITTDSEQSDGSTLQHQISRPVPVPPAAKGNCCSHPGAVRNNKAPTSKTTKGSNTGMTRTLILPSDSVHRVEIWQGHAHRCCHHTNSPDGGVRGAYYAASAPSVLSNVPLVQCVPVCPPPVLLYSSPVMKIDSHPQPFYVSVNDGNGVCAEVRGRREVRGHSGRSLSADQQISLNSSLNRAIQAARDMKHTSRRMARSLATGLHYQESLSQSCIY
ncbi:microtubule organization protein AKNA [Lampris incognitus]|uniref:microtubule organization protein AKNA n=1 Tax=Lampris incognitus TaxID=2546036 RepID=UPI0024B5A146|nr:microtubule organization protein AKNA [Lampris incognitus]